MHSPGRLERSLVDSLVRFTVHSVLFGDEDNAVSAPPSTPLDTEKTLAVKQVADVERFRPTPSTPETPISTADKTPELADSPDARQRRLLHQLFVFNAADCQADCHAEDEAEAVVSQQQVLQCCCQWPRETLASVKAELKAFLRSVSTHTSGRDGAAPCEPRHAQVFETYALVKLFLLEKDERYRALRLADVGDLGDCRRRPTAQHRFLVLLQVQLALYAHYFELSYGRKITQDADVRPVRAVYSHFLAHRRVLTTG